MSETYFLYHSIGQYPGKARDLAAAMAEFAVVWGAGDDGQWAYVLDRRQRFIDRWRAILNAGPGTVTTFENVTSGFHALLTALPPGHLRGKTVLVGADCFPSNHFLLAGMAEALGFTLKTVPLRQGAAHVEDEDFLDAWTPDVGLGAADLGVLDHLAPNCLAGHGGPGRARWARWWGWISRRRPG